MTSHCISIALIKRRLKEEKRNTALTQSHTEYISRLLILNSEPHKKTLKLVSEVKKKSFFCKQYTNISYEKIFYIQRNILADLLLSSMQIFSVMRRKYSIFKKSISADLSLRNMLFHHFPMLHSMMTTESTNIFTVVLMFNALVYNNMNIRYVMIVLTMFSTHSMNGIQK